jgi:hypothetical protein
MLLSRAEFLRLLVIFAGAGGALAEACDTGDRGTPGPKLPWSDPWPETLDGRASAETSATTDASDASDATDANDDANDATTDVVAIDSPADAIDEPPPLDCDANGARDFFITGNHGHDLVIPQGDFVVPAIHSYSIAGSALHDHTITLTAAQMTAIEVGGLVTVTSTVGGGGHTHDVTVQCA